MVGRSNSRLPSPADPAFMGIKVWAESGDSAVRMARAIGRHVGFTMLGKVEVYATDPEQPCGEKPFGYGIQFTPYDRTDDSPALPGG